ncbi:hypothetical protein QTO34_016201 [Cnephaeus nilssonii]|uniref:Uncharacterized protein n=1 Tax=Cnephaeus nilssonii TaxID=3371016 RepID=A0AA40I5R8_CNENI|nr:hypothetical protein QTO34_016201 [Eptesicus nilssonii]
MPLWWQYWTADTTCRNTARASPSFIWPYFSKYSKPQVLMAVLQRDLPENTLALPVNAFNEVHGEHVHHGKLLSNIEAQTVASISMTLVRPGNKEQYNAITTWIHFIGSSKCFILGMRPPQRPRVIRNGYACAEQPREGRDACIIAMAMMQAFHTAPAAQDLWAAWEGGKAVPGPERKGGAPLSQKPGSQLLNSLVLSNHDITKFVRIIPPRTCDSGGKRHFFHELAEQKLPRSSGLARMQNQHGGGHAHFQKVQKPSQDKSLQEVGLSLQLDILSTATEAGEAPTTAAALTSHGRDAGTSLLHTTYSCETPKPYHMEQPLGPASAVCAAILMAICVRIAP